MALNDWAKEMADVIHSVAADVDVTIGGMGSSDGDWVSSDEGERIVTAFENAGFEKTAIKNGTYQIFSKLSKQKGVVVDMCDEPGAALLYFFDETM